MKAVVFTLGCKVNEVESASIMAALESVGVETSAELGYADLYILNTCAVTREAERKSRQLISRVKKHNPSAPIYVCGCASQKDEGQFSSRGVKFVCGARNKQEVLNAVISDFALAPCGMAYPKQVRTRSFIKIQDGCDNFCSYCVIPYLRGRSISRSVKEVAAEVAATESDEIVLTGINLSSYGDKSQTLETLINSLAFCESRIRLGSLECRVITPEFLSALKRLKDFAPQFHLSLQSGSNAVLKRMNRRYTREEYLEKCALIYGYFPDAAITTDIIVGFCGETEEDFNDSLSIISKARFARVHAFAFSPREGTKAYSLDDIPAPIKSQRLKKLIDEAHKYEEEFILSRKGKVRTAVFEEYDGEFSQGYTEDYIKVYVKGNYDGKKAVCIKEIFKDGALAEIV